MSYQVTFAVPLYGSVVEVEVWALPAGTVGLSVDSCAEGGVVYLNPAEARRIAAALAHAADEQEQKK